MKAQQYLLKMIITAATLGGLMILQGCSGEQEAAPKAPVKAASAPAAAPTDTAAPAEAASSAIDGQALYAACAACHAACAACHAAGVANAPKLGDAAAWAPRIATGMDAMVANAIKGKGAMPPKGGRMDYNDEQIKAIVEYMVNASK